MLKQGKRIITLSVFIVLLFCASFVFFFQRAQKQSQASAAAPSARTDKALPQAHLFDQSGAPFNDEALRKGKVVLIFMTLECGACRTEAEFLTTIVGKHPDVSYYGVLSTGEKRVVLQEAAEKNLLFKMLYDDGFELAGQLGIRRVPVKLFLKDGIMKYTWGGATTDEEKKAAFIQYLDDLK